MTHGTWKVDEVVSQTLEAGVSYTMMVTIKGASVSLVLNGQFIRSRAYNAALADGRTGVLVAAGSASFGSYRVRTDGYDPEAVSVAVAAPAPAEPVEPPADDPLPDPPPSEPEPTDPPPPAPEPEPVPEPEPAPDPWVPPGRAKKN